MKRPEFTEEQEQWLISTTDNWYLSWKGRITEGQHRLGMAKEELKALFCGERLIDIGVSMATCSMIQPSEFFEHYLHRHEVNEVENEG